MVKPTFAQKVEALEKFFGSSSSAPLQERINGWNAQMGLGETPIGSNGLPIPMPDQIECLIADTGIVVEAVLHKDAPRPPSDLKLVEYVEKVFVKEGLETEILVPRKVEDPRVRKHPEVRFICRTASSTGEFGQCVVRLRDLGPLGAATEL